MQVVCSQQTNYRFRTNTTLKPSNQSVSKTQHVAPTTDVIENISIPEPLPEDIKRFERAIKRKDIKSVRYALEAGVRPTTQQMCFVIQHCHVDIAEMCIDSLDEIDVRVLKQSMKRHHEPLFCKIVKKVNTIEGSIVDMFVDYKPQFLFQALQHGLNPDTTLKNGGTLIEKCYKKQKYQWVFVLLHAESITIQPSLMNLLMRHHEYIPLCIKHGATPKLTMILNALQENNTPLLKIIIEGVDALHDNKPAWEQLKDILTCPITQELTTNVNKTPAGHYYERESIRRWVQEKQTDPMTRASLKLDDLQERVKCLFTLRHQLQKLIQNLMA